MFYGAIDVGGTKTLVAIFNQDGEVVEKFKFPTPPEYENFLTELEKTFNGFETQELHATALAMPGLIDHDHGILVSYGNLPWKNVHAVADIEKIVNCPVVLENDAKLAGLSEALLIPEYERVLYVTISTGIGTGLIVHGKIDRPLRSSEAGQMMLVHKGKLEKWESFASGKAIVARYGKRAAELDDPEAWKVLSRDFAQGFLTLIATIQPDAIVIGGGVGSHFDKFGDLLIAELKKYETPMVPVPPILAAKNPEEAVIHGCFALLKQRFHHQFTAPVHA
jgi:predicted NBD/HSP70 family sugar kinase